MPAKPHQERFLEERRRKSIKPFIYETRIDTWSSASDESEYESDSSGNAVMGDRPDGHSMWGEFLPQEILVEIFSMVVKKEGALPFLSRVSGVCRSWRNAASDSVLWREVDLTRYKQKFPLMLRWMAVHRLRTVTKLNLSCWGQLKSEDFRFLFDSCRQLQTLDLSHCHLTPIAIKALRSLPNLQNLNLSKTPRAIMISKVLSPMLRNLGPRLRELNLSGNHIKGCAAVLDTLMDNCPNTTLIDFSSCTYSSSQNLLNIEKLQTCCTKLRVLRLHDTNLPAVEAIRKDVLASPGFPDLEELDISVLSTFRGNSSVLAYDDDFILRLLRKSPQLRHLDAGLCLNVSENSLLKLAASELKYLRITGCSDSEVYSGIHEIIGKWKHSLEYVDLSRNKYYPDGSLDQALCLMGQHGTPVRSLNLAATKVSRDALKSVLTGCRQLTTLDLTRTSSRDLKFERGTRRRHVGRKALDELLKTLS